MADDLDVQQEYIEYLQLREVWKNIGLSLEKEELEKWRAEFTVNIAVLDSGVSGDHEAFQSSRHTQPKVLKSFVMKNGERLNDNGDVLGHGTFCAGVAAGYPIPSPKKVKDYKIQKLAERFSKLQQLPEGSRKTVEDIFDGLSGGDLEDFPFVGVAPFANIISYKVIDDNDDVDEEVLACTLQDLVKYNSNVEFKEKIHIVSMSLSAHYHDGVRRALYDVLNDDMIVVAAACNMGQRNNYCNGNIWFPARFGNVVSVGSHDNHGQPSKISSVGREVHFLAPGEEIWGPYHKENGSIEKDEGTSVSAAIVSGIVALVLAFVHKEKGLDARTEISNNPVMKKILRNMATRREQHDEVMGYGSLKPLVVFGYGAHVLWDLWDSKPTVHVSSSDEIGTSTTAVNNVVLRDHLDYECLVEDALYGLQFAKKVKVIDLAWLCQKNSSLLLEKVSEAIKSSNVEVVERLHFLAMEPYRSWFDLVVQFLKNLPQTVLAHLSRLDIFCILGKGIPCKDLSKIADIIGDAKQNEANTSITLIFAQKIVPAKKYRDIPDRNKVKISIGIDTSDKDDIYVAGVIKKRNLINVTTCCFDMYDSCFGIFVGTSGFQAKIDQQHTFTDRILSSISKKSRQTFADNFPSEVYPRLSSLSNSGSSDEKITVAILGDQITIHLKDIRGELWMSDKHNSRFCFKSFTRALNELSFSFYDVGTLCNFIIAGESNGIAPFVNLVYAKVTDHLYFMLDPTETVVAGLKWIEEEHNEVDIVVFPFGFKEFDSNLYKAINNLSKGKIVICAASGSDNSTRPVVTYPACYGDVISVGSHSSVFQPSAFSPQGREIDVLALGEYVTIKKHLKYVYPLDLKDYQIWEKRALSGTCVAVACAAGVVAQIMRRGLQCGFKRAEIANNTVARELLRQLTGNFSHNPQTGYGCLPDVSKSLLFRNDDYFKEIVNEILNR